LLATFPAFATPAVLRDRRVLGAAPVLMTIIIKPNFLVIDYLLIEGISNIIIIIIIVRPLTREN